MVHFATTNPELANHVHRLQLRVHSSICSSTFTFPGYQPGDCRLSRAPEDHDPLTREMAGDGDLVVGSPRKRRADRIARISVGEVVWDHSRTIKETLTLLPNLFHLENAMSTHYQKRLAETEARLADYDWIALLDLYEKPEHAQALALLKGVRGIISHIAEKFTSLKLRGVAAIDKHVTSNLPKNLQHLDLDLRILWTLGEDLIPGLDGIIFEEWRRTLKTLTELKSLRLTFTYGLDDFTAEEHIHEHMWTNAALYVDDFLVGPRDSADQCYFPRLRSLRLANCSLRVRGLQTIAMQHSATLKELELSRVTLDTLYCVGSWSEIGTMCHRIVPNLTYLRLAKLITFSPIRGLKGTSRCHRYPTDGSEALREPRATSGSRMAGDRVLTAKRLGPSAPGINEQGRASRCKH